jgi:hypothetical protein
MNGKQSNEARLILGGVGVILIVFAGAWAIWDLQAAVCAGLGVMGFGLIMDAWMK